MEQKTPLYAKHAAAGGKIVPFAGYLLPVQYPTGVIAEHMAVRTAAGLFDVSHMGELVFTGPDALRNLNHLLTNDFTGMYDGQVRYSPMCNDQGGCVDDLIVYKVHDTAYLVVVNAANKDKDAGWMREHLFGACEMEDISGRVAQVALQGPKSKQILLRLLDESVLPQKYYSFVRDVDLRGIRCLISRTGYTGEFGYELYCVSADAEGLWDLLLEAGLDFAVKMGKEDFIGKDAIAARLPVRQTRVGLEITGRGIAREHQDIYIGDRLAGQTTSGTHCPFLGKAVAMAYLSSADAVPGTRVEVDVRGRRVAAQVVELPFYKR